MRCRCARRHGGWSREVVDRRNGRDLRTELPVCLPVFCAAAMRQMPMAPNSPRRRAVGAVIGPEHLCNVEAESDNCVGAAMAR